MAAIELRNIRKAFGAVEVIKGVNLEVRKGEFMVFVGPSGSSSQAPLQTFRRTTPFRSGGPSSFAVCHWLEYVSPLAPGHDFFETRNV